MKGEKMEDIKKTIDLVPVFDYGSIKEEHQSAALEIAGLLKSLGHTDIAEEILVRFQIEQIPTYDMEESVFVQEMKEAGIYVAIQGFLKEGSGKNAFQYPLIAVNGDIRQFNQLIENLKTKYGKNT
jgi:predicted ATPase with chaperone activity